MTVAVSSVGYCTGVALVHCYSCGADLEAAIHDTEQEALECEQWDNALVVEVHGGFGMFFDSLGQEDVQNKAEIGLLQNDGKKRVVLCHDCGHKACDVLPWLSHLIDPERAHSHRVDPGPPHKGWDLPHDCPECGTRLEYNTSSLSGNKYCPKDPTHDTSR